LCFIGLVLYCIMQQKAEKFSTPTTQKKNCNKRKNNTLNKIFENGAKTNFVETHFHTDYRDTMNAFNILTEKKVLFNDGMLKVDNASVDSTEIEELAKLFIDKTNDTVTNEVKGELSNDGWFDFMPQKEIKSGWDIQQERLGLPNSLYDDTKQKAPIHLIKIDHAAKYVTEKELKYDIYIIIQKGNTPDQLLVKVSFVIKRQHVHDKKNAEIAEIFIVGVLYDVKGSGKRNNFYNFSSMEDDVVRDDLIMKELIKKREDNISG